MAKLNKVLEDHFCIPILLKPIGNTSEEKVSYFRKLLSDNFSNFQLGVDEASEVITYLKDVLKERPTNINPYYKLKFNEGEEFTEWPELQLLYKSQFVIGINDSQEEDVNKIKENLAKFRKQLSDERRQETAIFLLKADKGTYYSISVDKSFIFMPDVLQQDLVSFLEMEMNKIVKNIVLSIGEEIKKLQNQENEYIVFNKNEEKPEQRTLKKKKKGRCSKIIGDYCLMIGSEDDALEYYKEGFELLKRLDDYLWMMAIEQGKAAAYLSKHTNNIKQGEEEEVSTEYLNLLNQSLIQSIQHIKKARLQSFIIQSYFIAFHAFEALGQRFLLEQWVGTFMSEQLKFYVAQDQAIYVSEIGLIYKKLEMLKKCNLYFFLAAQIYLLKQPLIARMFLNQIKTNSPSMKKWPKLYSLMLKQLIKSDPNDAFQGHTYAQLIDACHNILPQAELFSLTQKLNFSYFEKVYHSFGFLKFIKFNIQKPDVIPKLNRLVKIKKEGGFLIAPRKKEEEYKYEANQSIRFDCQFLSEIRFPMSLKLSLLTVPAAPTRTHNTLIQTKSSFTFSEKFLTLGNYIMSGLHIHIWNYHYDLKLPKQISIEVYQEHSHYEVIVDEQLIIQKSSEFQFQFQIRNNKPSITSHMVKVNISIYYSLEVGLQENIIFLNSDQLQSRNLRIVCRESEGKSVVVRQDPVNTLNVELEKLKVHRQYLKKVEITLESIRTETSKYQINVDKIVPVMFREKIMFQVTNIRSESSIWLLSDKNNLPVWQNQFTLKVRVSKHQDDKKVYEIEMFTKDDKLVTKRILGDMFSFNEIIRFDKVGLDVEDIEKYLSGCAYLNWRSMTNQKEHGMVHLRTQGDYNKLLARRSPKSIEIQYYKNQSRVRETSISIQNGERLSIKYKVTSSTPFNHRVYLESTLFKQTSTIGYLIQGRTLIKQTSSCSNTIEVQFCTSYSNKYVVILQFDDQLYISQETICVQYGEQKQ